MEQDRASRFQAPNRKVLERRHISLPGSFFPFSHLCGFPFSTNIGLCCRVEPIARIFTLIVRKAMLRKSHITEREIELELSNEGDGRGDQAVCLDWE